MSNGSKEKTLKEIERGYGVEVANALLQYCTKNKLDLEEVVYDTDEDGNGMTPWDKFDVWANRKLGLNIMGNFDDTYDWSGAEERERKERERAEQEKEDELAFKKGLREIQKNKKDLKKLRRNLRRKSKKGGGERFGHVYQAPTDFSLMNEGSGSRMDEYAISDKLWEYLNDCEWVEDIDTDNGEDGILITVDGKNYRVKVEKEYARLKRHLSDDEIDELGFDREHDRW